MTRAAIYARVSSEKQRDNYSLDTQLDGCRKYALDRGLTVQADHEFVEAHTASVVSRPQLDKLLDLAETGQVDTLIVYHLDRLSRGGPGDQYYLDSEFKRHGVKIEY